MKSVWRSRLQEKRSQQVSNAQEACKHRRYSRHSDGRLQEKYVIRGVVSERNAGSNETVERKLDSRAPRTGARHEFKQLASTNL